MWITCPPKGVLNRDRGEVVRKLSVCVVNEAIIEFDRGSLLIGKLGFIVLV